MASLANQLYFSHTCFKSSRYVRESRQTDSDFDLGDSTMRCPRCGHEESKVVDSRPSENNDAIRRRRECVSCGCRFTTYERREDMPLMVAKRDNRKETFDRTKLMRGLLAATVKRNIKIELLEALISDIESELRDRGINEISSQDLGMMVLQRLVDIDKVAYVRFASVYRDFKDIDEFNEELRSLSQ